MKKQYAVMIKERYARYLQPVWITASVYDTLEEAALESCKFHFTYPYKIVEYHSREWESLVQ